MENADNKALSYVRAQLGDREARRVLRILRSGPAYQHARRPLQKLKPLLAVGAASVSRRWEDDRSAVYGHSEEIRITELGERLDTALSPAE